MLVESNFLQKETLAPDFKLINTLDGQMVSLVDEKGAIATVVMFICNHCPFVLHVNDELVRLANDYMKQGVGFIAISSNDVNYVPQDGPEQMKLHAQKQGYPFVYLYDETQEVAKSYDAACTPDFYVFDQNFKSVYHGQLCDSRPSNKIKVTGASIRSVLDALIAKKPIEVVEEPSIGCNIKWK